MEDKKKVVHITTVHHPLDPRIYYKQCLSFQKAGYDVTLIAPEESNIGKSQVNVIPLKKYKSRLGRMIFSTMEAFKHARKLKADYYHIHDPELLPAARLLKNKHNVIVYDIHEDYITSIKQKSYLPKAIRNLIAHAYKFIEKKLTKPMELCLAEKYYKDIYPDGQCILNYPIINSRILKHSTAALEGSRKLIYTGNVTVDRGALIHASLPALDQSLMVTIVGKCSSHLAEKMFESAGVSKNRLRIEGVDQYIPKKDIDSQYISQKWLAGLALFPPTEHYMKKELTKFFEYMNAGIPIICSNFPIWKQFIEKYNCGIAVDPYNQNEIKSALEYMSSNSQRAKQMGLNGQEAILKELNWEMEEKKLLDWYKKIWLKNKSNKKGRSLW